jgi:hypothetical protein
MKYSVGDLLLIKEHIPQDRPLLRRRRRYGDTPRYKHFNSFGMITQAIKHSDVWEGPSTSDNNVYVWYSQIDGEEYSFCENEVTGEVIK